MEKISNTALRWVLALGFIWGMGWAAENPDGFSVIKFGTEKEKTIEKLVSKYKFERTPEGIISKNGSKLHNSQNTLWISDLPLGSKRVTVWFYFNANDKFYKFEIESPSYQHGKADEKVKNEAEFLSKVFEQKYGTPKKRYGLSYLNLKEGYLSFHWKWEFPGSVAYTAFKLEGKRANVLAVAAHSKLEKEKKKTLAGTANKEVKDAASSF